MTVGSELAAAQSRIHALEETLTRLQAVAEGEGLASELRTRLTEVGAAGVIDQVGEHTELLEQIVETAMHVLEANAGAVYEVAEETNELIFQAVVGGGGEQLRGRRMPIGYGIAGWVAATGQAIGVADLEHDSRWAQEIGREVNYTPRTMLAMPLLLHEQVIGVLQLLDKRGGEPFPGQDIETLGLFARQAAVAIAHSRLLHRQSSLLAALLADLGHGGDLAERATAFVAGVEASEEYRETLQLAGLLGEIARHGDAGRRLSLDVAGAVTRYLRAQHRAGR
jgi:GAF domain-containing protein